MTEPINASGVGQEDYLKLFMQELSYQDPLKPIDNREFMAQMAQFSALQEARATNQGVQGLLGMISANQSLNLLGKQIKMNTSEELGTVKYVQFYEQEEPKLFVLLDKGGYTSVVLKNISEVEA